MCPPDGISPDHKWWRRPRFWRPDRGVHQPRPLREITLHALPDKDGDNLFESRTTSEQYVYAQRKTRKSISVPQKCNTPKSRDRSDAIPPFDQYMNTYVMFRFRHPVQATGGKYSLMERSIARGIEKTIFPGNSTAWEHKTTGIQTFLQELSGWKRKSGCPGEPFGYEGQINACISSDVVWVGSRERYLHGNGKKPQFTWNHAEFFPRELSRRLHLLM